MKTIRKKAICILLSLCLILPTGIPVSANERIDDLIERTSDSDYPLREYSDAFNIASEYAESWKGKKDNFLNQWNVINLYYVFHKNKFWANAYEQVLVDILSKEGIVKEYLDSNGSEIDRKLKLIDCIDDLIDYDVLGDEIKSINMDAASDAADMVKAGVALAKDLLKQTFLTSQAKIELLYAIGTQASNVNLTDAVQRCMNSEFTNTYNFFMDKLVDIVKAGAKKAGAFLNDYAAKRVIRNQILQTSLTETLVETIPAVAALGQVAMGLFYALVVLDVKDLVIMTNGTKGRADAYMDIIARRDIYDGVRETYAAVKDRYISTGEEEYGSLMENLFNTMLVSVRGAYSDLEVLLDSEEKPISWFDIVFRDDYNLNLQTELKKRLNGNPDFKERYDKIQKLTIDNYKEEYRMQEIPEKGRPEYNNGINQSSSETVKAGNYYISWTQKTSYDIQDASTTCETTVYKSKKSSGSKTEIISIKKPVQFIATDGSFIYYDTGEEPSLDPDTGRHLSDSKRINLWKTSIENGMQTSIATITSEEINVTNEYDGTSQTLLPYTVGLESLYGKYAYFLPEAVFDNGGGNGIVIYPWSWMANSVIRVNLISGEKTSIPFESNCYTLSSSRFLINMAEKSNELFCIDFKKGVKKLISNKCMPLCTWQDMDAGLLDPVTIIEDEIYYFEDSPSGARVVRYNMASDEWEYLTEPIADITSDVTARPYKGFAHYRINDKWYRYFYKTKTTEETDWIPHMYDFNGYAEYGKFTEDYANIGYYRYYYETGIEESISWDSLTKLN